MAVDPLPGGQEGSERLLLGRLDLLAQRRQRGAAQAAQHLDVAPLPSGATGAQLTAHDVAVALELTQYGGGVDAVALAQLVGREGAVRACVAGDEHAQRVGHVGEERLG